MDNIFFDKGFEALNDVQDVRDGFSLDKLSLLFDFGFEIAVFAKLGDNVNRIILVELGFDLYYMRFWSEFPLNVQLISEHFFLVCIIKYSFIEALDSDFLI